MLSDIFTSFVSIDCIVLLKLTSDVSLVLLRVASVPTIYSGRISSAENNF